MINLENFVFAKEQYELKFFRDGFHHQNDD